jgi:hypothetical protein
MKFTTSLDPVNSEPEDNKKVMGDLSTRRLYPDIICYMQNTERIRLLADVPTHGFGLLGGLAHSVLAEYDGVALPAPQLHLGQNTLPDPPLPLPAQVPFGDLKEGWRECGKDLVNFLETGARTLRAQATPDISQYSQQVRILQKVLRFDAIAMVWESHMTRPAGATRWSLAEDVAGGRRDPEESAPVLAVPAVVTWVVDRAGNSLLGWFPAAGTRADIEILGDAITTDDRIVALLRDVLLAQYAWTSIVFGLVS